MSVKDTHGTIRGERLRVVILTNKDASNLIDRLAALDTVNVVAVFLETASKPERGIRERLQRSVRYDGWHATIRKISATLLRQSTNGKNELNELRSAQSQMIEYAERFGIPLHRVQNFNSKATEELLQQVQPDLGVLFGTNIIKESIFSLPRLGSINLHKGKAPCYRGGPTVFWELFNDEKELGITVHFVAQKVDTGDIVLQQTLPLEYNFDEYGLQYDRFIADYRASLVEPSLNLLTEAIRLISIGKEKRTVQDASMGRRNRLPTKREKDELLRRLRERRRRQIGALL